MSVDSELLAKLACPLTRTKLRYDGQRSELISEAAQLAFPVRAGSPILLIEEARRLDP